MYTKKSKVLRLLTMGYDAGNAAHITSVQPIKRRVTAKPTKVTPTYETLSREWDTTDMPRLIGLERWMERQKSIEKKIRLSKGAFTWDDTNGNEPLQSNMQSIIHHIYEYKRPYMRDLNATETSHHNAD